MKKYLVKFVNNRFQKIDQVEDPYNLNFYENYIVCKKQQDCVERSIVVDAKSQNEAIDLAYHMLYDSCDWIIDMLKNEMFHCEQILYSLKENNVEIDSYKKRVNFLKRLTCGVI